MFVIGFFDFELLFNSSNNGSNVKDVEIPEPMNVKSADDMLLFILIDILIVSFCNIIFFYMKEKILNRYYLIDDLKITHHKLFDSLFFFQQ